MNPLLDNIAWNTLSGPHAGFATGTDRARRYAPGFSPIVGFADAEHPDFAVDPVGALVVRVGIHPDRKVAERPVIDAFGRNEPFRPQEFGRRRALA
mgnify:CR=1 FL=1